MGQERERYIVTRERLLKSEQTITQSVRIITPSGEFTIPLWLWEEAVEAARAAETAVTEPYRGRVLTYGTDAARLVLRSHDFLTAITVSPFRSF
jgi:hypothetical protein